MYCKRSSLCDYILSCIPLRTENYALFQLRKR